MSKIIEFKNVIKEYKSGDHILKAMEIGRASWRERM